MNFKKILISGAAGALMFGSLAVGAFASPQGQNLNASKCDTGKLIINVTYKVTNDTDSGVHGNWATDNYNKKVQVWQQTNTTFCAIVKYEGQFVTTGPLSPQNGEFLASGIKGTFQGGYNTVTFEGTLNSDVQTHGNLGTYDFDKTSPFDWVSYYFGTSADNTFDLNYWSWTYRAGNNGTWVNSVLENTGDITGN